MTPPSASAGSFTQPSTSYECVPANVARQRIGGNLSINEHRRLFGYGNTGNVSKGKGKATTKRQTCTLKFVCLGKCDPVKPPTSVKERTVLCNAGLGDTTIVFNVNGDSDHCHRKILETFPKLAQSGYELLLYDRAGENSSFCPLKHPYLPKKLKEVAGQCKIYIKPLQKDLIESDNDEDEVQV